LEVAFLDADQAAAAPALPAALDEQTCLTVPGGEGETGAALPCPRPPAQKGGPATLSTLHTWPLRPTTYAVLPMTSSVVGRSSPSTMVVGLREPDRALDWLERGGTSEMYVSYLGIDPTFGPLHAEPRFRELLRRVGLDG
jgi:hypothetical protein